MTDDYGFWIRMVTVAALSTVTVSSGIGVWVSRGTRFAGALTALTALCGGATYNVATLVGTQVTVRTWVTFAVSLVALGAVIWSWTATRAEDVFDTLPARTRSLIKRHADVLPAFARWHRNHGGED